MLDRDGFRPNVGIILLNQRSQVFWGKRISIAWSMPLMPNRWWYLEVKFVSTI